METTEEHLISDDDQPPQAVPGDGLPPESEDLPADPWADLPLAYGDGMSPEADTPPAGIPVIDASTCAAAR